MGTPKYMERAVDAFLAGKNFKVTGRHINMPDVTVRRVEVIGDTLFSYGEPILVRYGEKLLLNATPYIIDTGANRRRWKISRVTTDLQRYVAQRLWSKQELRDATVVFDFAPTGKYRRSHLMNCYDDAVARGDDELITLYEYVRQDCYTDAMQYARKWLDLKSPKSYRYTLVYTTVTINAANGGTRIVDELTGEILAEYDEHDNLVV